MNWHRVLYEWTLGTINFHDNLKFFAKLLKVEVSYIDILMRKFDLYEHLNKIANKLSTGMKQRLILIRSTLHKPKLFF